MVATKMSSLFVALFALVASSFRSRAALQAEILALRHQLSVFQKNAPRRLRLHRCDRLLWGAPRIHGELLKLGIAVAQSTVAKYLPRPGKPPSQTWRTFLTNHLVQTTAIDFFTVPTVTFRVLFVFVALSHERRRVVHFGVTEHATQEWTMQRLREAFPWDEAPRYVLRDPDAIYGRDFAALTRDMGIEEVLTAPRSPWQNPFAERLVGSIRRECLDHV